MATIQVVLDENEIRDACEYWATTRVLNEGRAISSELLQIGQSEKTGILSGCTVWVETDRMNKPN